jgi:hypothetical protein
MAGCCNEAQWRACMACGKEVTGSARLVTLLAVLSQGQRGKWFACHFGEYLVANKDVWLLSWKAMVMMCRPCIQQEYEE